MTTIDISIQIDEAYTSLIHPEMIERAFSQTLILVESTAASVAIIITGNEVSCSLNQQYRGLDQPTDVLSFQNESDPDFLNNVPHLEESFHLGDIIIAYPIAEQQALAGGHSPTEEIMLLTIHGTLHLLGFDHDTPPHKKEMWDQQRQILEGLGLGHVQPTET